MKFAISRSSDFIGTTAPIEGAYKGKYQLIDIRYASDLMEIPYYQDIGRERAEKDWYEEGTNHRLIDGKIARDLCEEDCWYVDINTLEELIDLQNKYGSIIIEDKYNTIGIKEIEIYDTYRE